MKFKLASNGRLFVPDAQGIVPMSEGINYNNEGQNIRDKIEDRSRLADKAEKIAVITAAQLNMSSLMQKSSGSSAVMRPDFTAAITSGTFILSTIPAIVTLGVVAYLKRQQK